jgi:L-iditol 2-dehydrogenase
LKALIYTKPYSFEYSDFPDPEAGDDDVLVRVKACGICGSDVHGFTGKTGRRLPPLIMGHEAAGIVEGFGKNVSGFEKGDRVCFDSTVYCNKCESCLAGLFNRCDKRQVLGVSVPAFKRHGAFAEYVAVPSWIVSKIPDELSFVHAALLEPASIGTHAANRAPISNDDTVVVIGTGTIGLFILQAARLRGAAKVIAVDINEFRLDLAKKIWRRSSGPTSSSTRSSRICPRRFCRKQKAKEPTLLSKRSAMQRLSQTPSL